MEYAKFINNNLTKLVRFPNGMVLLVKDKKVKRNPTHEEILSAGYLPIEETTEPESRDGFIKSSKWVQTDSAIVKKWSMKRDMRPLSQGEISKKLIEQQINTLAVDDNTALRMKSYYPEWASGVGYSVGYKVQHNGKLWRVVQAHTAQVGWEPEIAASLWEQINETHDGTIYDAIPYEGNMALESGKYYVQNDVIYLCNRDTVNPVYHALAELVGLYVEEV
jgi:hypothetical protein